MAEPTFLIIVVIVAAVLFDYMNGWNDSANAIATVVSTRVLSPGRAVMLAAVLNLAGALVSVKVAATLTTGIVDPALISQTAILACMVAAASWVWFCTAAGLPISGSHSLIGALVGSALAKNGSMAVLHMAGIKKVLLALLISPLAGFAISFVLMGALLWIFRKWSNTRVQRTFGKLQLASVSLMAWEHGKNDAQKVMGVITLALIAGGFQSGTEVQLWVKLVCATAMALGTAAGGWKVIRTLGSSLIKIQPVHGFAAETGASITLAIAAHIGAPVSTTHTITGAIMGVGATRRLSAVRWGLGGKIMMAWVFTLPTCAALGALVYWLLKLFGLDAPVHV
ncbi:MAG TPA: inorganic phosphate transporter [Planctomycetota bacterium]|nr:inorganic phosphate transporter [Planctomycetota bacterium]